MSFAPGDLVRVRTEPVLSEIVLPTHRKPDCMPDDVPELLICCVPVALVRTPVETGVLRWIELRDLAAAEPENETSGSDATT